MGQIFLGEGIAKAPVHQIANQSIRQGMERAFRLSLPVVSVSKTSDSQLAPLFCTRWVKANLIYGA